jgi:hypothetical protein
VSWLSPIPPEPPKMVNEPRKKVIVMPDGHPGRGGHPVEWNGRKYPTIRACASAMGISQWALRRKLGLKHDPRKRHDIR